MGRALLFIFLVGGAVGMIAHRVPRPAHALASLPVATATEMAGNRAEKVSAPVDANAVTLERNSDGHFYADVEINGTPVHMLVDTGASGVALSRDDARSAGIATSIGMNDVIGQGADGAVRGEPVRIDRMRLGSASAEGVNAVVFNAGQMSLLGQDFLQRFASVEIRDDRMVLR